MYWKVTKKQFADETSTCSEMFENATVFEKSREAVWRGTDHNLPKPLNMQRDVEILEKQFVDDKYEGSMIVTNATTIEKSQKAV